MEAYYDIDYITSPLFEKVRIELGFNCFPDFKLRNQFEKCLEALSFSCNDANLCL